MNNKKHQLKVVQPILSQNSVQMTAVDMVTVWAASVVVQMDGPAMTVLCAHA
jgi:uncharacterized protein YbaP (TraB family)